MSDDEFIYDDDDDWYWYEEDNMGLGDDLAENAVHSPIMVEDPSLETIDTYSDWEYYSDDYYDDDPTITTKHKTNGEPCKKRRKLSSIENIPSLSLGSSIVDSSTSMENSYKGVLWRVPVNRDEKIELYEPGKGEPVSLLSDWRELFKAPTHQKEWLSNGTKASERESTSDVNLDTSSVAPKAIEGVNLEGLDAKYGRYSPPPLAIEDLDKTISRQREKLSQSELQIAPEKLPAERMIVADSEDEGLDEMDEADESTAAVEGTGAVDDDKENMIVETDDQLPVVRVEVPTLAAAMKQDAKEQSTPPRKRGRKPKTTTTAKSSTNKASDTPKKAVSTPTPAKRGRKRVLEAEMADEGSHEDNKRRSKRVASTSDNKATRENGTDKKRTRTNSIASPRQEHGRKRKV